MTMESDSCFSLTGWTSWSFGKLLFGRWTK